MIRHGRWEPGHGRDEERRMDSPVMAAMVKSGVCTVGSLVK